MNYSIKKKIEIQFNPEIFVRSKFCYTCSIIYDTILKIFFNYNLLFITPYSKFNIFCFVIYLKKLELAPLYCLCHDKRNRNIEPVININ